LPFDRFEQARVHQSDRRLVCGSQREHVRLIGWAGLETPPSVVRRIEVDLDRFDRLAAPAELWKNLQRALRRGGADCIEPRVRLLVLAFGVAAFALTAVGCGGSPTSGSPGSSGSAADDELAVPTAGWETDFSKHSVPLTEFVSGGPGKDGIPSIDGPQLVSVEEAGEWLSDREPVIELVHHGIARAYPIQILVWHEIVNDEVAGTPVAVTFCPLCNTALAFDRRVDGEVLDFGTTGNLRNSDLVMYDRQTESWWQQFGGEAVVGELTGTELEQLPARIVAWEDFASRHPGGEVLSQDTGYPRSYGRNPYEGYDDVDSGPLFPVSREDDRLAPKERVVFMEHGDDAVVVPFAVLAERNRIQVEVGGEAFAVEWLPGVRSPLDSGFVASGREVGSATVTAVATGEPVPFDQPFWFAVAAFRPDVRIVDDSD
jgi:Protein of unknown function (DUF3179)